MRTRKQRIIDEADDPGNNGDIGDIEHVPVEPECVQREEVRHAPEAEAVDGIAGGPTHDQAQAGCDQLAGDAMGEPDGHGTNGQGRETREEPLPLARILQEKAVADAGILHELQIQEGQYRHPALVLDVEEAKHPPL